MADLEITTTINESEEFRQMLWQRLNWTTSWLNEQNPAGDPDDFEFIEHENAVDSDHGVESLSDNDALLFTPANFNDDEVSKSSHPSQESWWSAWVAYLNSSPLGCYCSYARKCVCANCKDSWRSYGSWSNWDEDFYREERRKIRRKDAIEYELAGRNIDNTFRDLRSASKARTRKRTESEKYWRYRAVKPGWMDAEHYRINERYDRKGSVPLPRMPVVTMTKQMLYREAQRSPRPPKYHRPRPRKCHWCWTIRYEQRVKDRKHAYQDATELVDHVEICDSPTCLPHLEELNYDIDREYFRRLLDCSGDEGKESLHPTWKLDLRAMVAMANAASPQDSRNCRPIVARSQVLAFRLFAY